MYTHVVHQLPVFAHTAQTIYFCTYTNTQMAHDIYIGT